MSEFIFQNKIKKILKSTPGIKKLIKLRYQIIRKRELLELLNAKKIIIFPAISFQYHNIKFIRVIIQEILKEWLDLYGIAHLSERTEKLIDAPKNAPLLFVPQAILRIPSSHAEYLTGVRHETRKAIRLSEKQGYEFREFIWDDHLNEIYEINTSKDFRQGEPMRGWYREHVPANHLSSEELQYRKYYGAFKNGILFAYFHFNVCGDLAVGKYFIGHAEHLKYGIMNGLISYTIRECVKNSSIQWIYLGDWQRIGSLNSFKRHAGCEEYAIMLNLENEQELEEYSLQKIKTRWRL